MRLITCLGLLLVIPAVALLNINDDDKPINQYQVIGSHNSYKKAIEPALFQLFKKMDSVSASKLDYEHIPLHQQLDMGLRNLELDVYGDSLGGKYAHPKGLDWAKNQTAFDVTSEMKKPGFKVFHVTELDFRSWTPTLVDALQQLKKWSDTNPKHSPVFITLEAKDDSLKKPGFTLPEAFTTQTFNQLDQTLIQYLGKEKIITPDVVRGKYKTLLEAVKHQNWPKLSRAEGKFLFILDAKGDKRDRYIAGHPALKNRVMFTNSAPNQPEAAFMILNNPKDAQIPVLVKAGFMVRTRADADTQQARKNDFSDFEAACQSGAQVITTDYYLKSTHFKSDYVVQFPGGKYFRPNPLFSK